jgi:hypothetical protein
MSTTNTRNTVSLNGTVNVKAMRTRIVSVLREASLARNFDERLAPLAVAAAALAKAFDDAFPADKK